MKYIIESELVSSTSEICFWARIKLLACEASWQGTLGKAVSGTRQALHTRETSLRFNALNSTLITQIFFYTYVSLLFLLESLSWMALMWLCLVLPLLWLMSLLSLSMNYYLRSKNSDRKTIIWTLVYIHLPHATQFCRARGALTAAMLTMLFPTQKP